MTTTIECPRCESPDPRRHPAVQLGGEVQPCPDDFHRQVTAENTPERIAKVDALLERMVARYRGGTPCSLTRRRP